MRPGWRLGVACVLAVLAGCAPRSAPPAPMPGQRPVGQVQAPPLQAPPPVRAWPRLDHEPELGVMLGRAASVRVRLLVPHRLPDGHELPAGNLDIAVQGDGVRVAGRHLATPRVELTPVAGGLTFSYEGTSFSGRLRLARARATIEVIELLPLETWLAGVLPAEMHPRWPVEALAAQAIVARSYAAARWQARAGEAWHLLRGTADVAYDGAVPPSEAVAAALARSRGQVLVHGGQAVLARFHACSGGRTEDSAALWPDATLVDGRTPLAGFMSAVDDDASVEGARGLGWTRTHQQWRAAITLDELSGRLAAWSRQGRGRPAIGAVHAVAVGQRHPSGRVASVVVAHGPGGQRRDEIPGNEFRLAVGANQLRSLWWEKAVMASARGGLFVVEGRGFGHGVGLPQVSAWWLAGDGMAGEDIVRRYYPGAALVRCWR